MQALLQPEPVLGTLLVGETLCPRRAPTVAFDHDGRVYTPRGERGYGLTLSP